MFDDDVNWWEQRPGILERLWWPIDHMRPEDWLGCATTLFIITGYVGMVAWILVGLSG